MPRAVFISYASKDQAVAEQVCTTLERRGLSCWMAPRDVPPGQEWAEAIVEAIEQSKALVLVFSEHANNSPAVGGELEKAFALGIPVFPFRIRQVEPSRRLELFIRRVQWVDALTPPIEQQIHRLAGAVHSLLGTHDLSEEPDKRAEASLNHSGRRGAAPPGRMQRRMAFLAVMCLAVIAAVGGTWLSVKLRVEDRPDESFDEVDVGASTETPDRNLVTPVVETAKPRIALPPTWENSIGMKLVLIQPGGFRMGSPDSDPDARAGEKPQHLVKITRPFYLGAYEVTQSEYMLVMGENPSYLGKSMGGRTTKNCPMESLTWSDAVKFCRKLSQREQRTYRLPTEAEWEYACRAGTTSRFATGDNREDLQRTAVIAGEKVSPACPLAVGSLQPNAWGLYDMLGNVREFCADWYGNYSASPQVDPHGPASGEAHVVRGGCYHFIWTDSRCASRFPVEDPAPNVGFRVVLEP